MALIDSAKDFLNVVNNPYGAPAKGEWSLIEGSFTSNRTKQKCALWYPSGAADGARLERAAMGTANDSGGRRKVVYEYPYRDGQRVADLGRRGETFSLQIVFYGPLYQNLFNQFIAVCARDGSSGILSHPARGNIPCAFQTYEFTHSHDMWNAVSIRATFIEDNQKDFEGLSSKVNSQNSSIRKALSRLSANVEAVQKGIDTVTTVKNLPASTVAVLKGRLGGVTDKASALIGSLAASFTTDAKLVQLASSAATQGLSLVSLSSGTVNGKKLAPVYQVGLTDEQSSIVAARSAAFVSANQITPQNAVYQTNAVRADISKGIIELQSIGGNLTFDAVESYRALAVELQTAVEDSLSSASASVKTFKVPYPMSLRKVAYLNGISPDRLEEVSNLNTEIPSINLIAKGYTVVVPAV